MATTTAIMVADPNGIGSPGTPPKLTRRSKKDAKLGVSGVTGDAAPSRSDSISPFPKLTGHETFVCRYAWLPKVVQQLNARPPLSFKDESAAMVRLGVGKNMVRSIRFWAESSGVIESGINAAPEVTPFGRQLLGHEGHDRFLQRLETLWLIHWKIATNRKHSLFHWHQMLNFWHRSEFTVSEAIPFLSRGLPTSINKRSERTLSDGLRVFINSYVATIGRKGEVAEDNLDCPLVELDFIRSRGERSAADKSGTETIYAFNSEDKLSITPQVFAFCLMEYWRDRHNGNDTLAFRHVSSGEGSPGQIFKLPELAVRNRVFELEEVTNGVFTFGESSAEPKVIRQQTVDEEAFLDAIYS